MDVDVQNKSVAELRQHLFKLFIQRFLSFRVKQMEELVPLQDLVFPLFVNRPACLGPQVTKQRIIQLKMYFTLHCILIVTLNHLSIFLWHLLK